MLDRLAREYAGSGRAELFDQLKVVLTDGPRSVSYASIATQLGMSEVAIQSAVQRVRRRYRDLVRERIAATLGDPSPAEVEDEIRALFSAWSGHPEKKRGSRERFAAGPLPVGRSRTNRRGRFADGPPQAQPDRRHRGR